MDDMITHNVGQVHLCIHLQDEATSPQQRERIQFGLGILLKPPLHLRIYYNYRMHLRSKERAKPRMTSNERERRQEKERGYSAKYEEGGRVGDVNYFLTHPKKGKEERRGGAGAKK